MSFISIRRSMQKRPKVCFFLMVQSQIGGIFKFKANERFVYITVDQWSDTMPFALYVPESVAKPHRERQVAYKAKVIRHLYKQSHVRSL